MPSIVVKIAGRGTPIVKQDGSPGVSTVGHMWVELVDDRSNKFNYGFAPAQGHEGMPLTLGEVYNTDSKTYQATSYEQTIPITQAQYDAMKQFGDATRNAGTTTSVTVRDVSGEGESRTYTTSPTVTVQDVQGADRKFFLYYNGLSNSCIDYAWKFLQVGGLNPSGAEGTVWPTNNAPLLEEVSKILEQTQKDAIGQLTDHGATPPPTLPPSVPGEYTVHTIDANGRLTASVVKDANGATVSETEYGYSADGNTVNVTYKNGAGAITRLDSVTVDPYTGQAVVDQKRLTSTLDVADETIIHANTYTGITQERHYTNGILDSESVTFDNDTAAELAAGSWPVSGSVETAIGASLLTPPGAELFVNDRLLPSLGLLGRLVRDEAWQTSVHMNAAQIQSWEQGGTQATQMATEASTAWGALEEALAAAGTEAAGHFRLFANGIQTDISTVPQRVIDSYRVVQETWGRIHGGISEVGNTVTDQFLRLASLIGDALDQAGQAIATATAIPLEAFRGSAFWGALVEATGMDQLGNATHSAIPDILENVKANLDFASTLPSPIILDLDGDGITTTKQGSGTHFDHDANGFAESTGWVAVGDGLLVRDLDGDGAIASGRELFGSETLLANGQKASNGFAALAELDANLDGKLDATDTAFATLKVWKDGDGNGSVGAGELLALNQAGIQNIQIASTASDLVDANGNQHRQIGNYTTTTGQTRTATDVWFQSNAMDSLAMERRVVPDDIVALPDIQGRGKVYDLRQAMVRDDTLKTLVVQFTQATTTAERETLLQSIIYKWTGVENIDPASRADKKLYGYNLVATLTNCKESVRGGGWISCSVLMPMDRSVVK
ncbi:MAG: hypothetical protein H7837_08565 [Magnetococcus sp. MYC-9]